MDEMLMNVLINILLSFLTLGGAYIIYFVNKLIIYLKQKTKSEELTNALNQVNKLAETTVKSIEQTAAKEIREAVKDGKATKDELKKLSNKAFEEIIKSLSPEYLSVLENGMGNIDMYVTNLIEQKVLELKKEVE